MADRQAARVEAELAVAVKGWEAKEARNVERMDNSGHIEMITMAEATRGKSPRWIASLRK